MYVLVDNLAVVVCVTFYATEYYELGLEISLSISQMNAFPGVNDC